MAALVWTTDVSATPLPEERDRFTSARLRLPRCESVVTVHGVGDHPAW